MKLLKIIILSFIGIQFAIGGVFALFYSINAVATLLASMSIPDPVIGWIVISAIIAIVAGIIAHSLGEG
jgi:hypothetical protein